MAGVNSQLPTPESQIGVGKLTTYLSFVRFSHSVFALPFALTGALLAWREQPFLWSQIAWIVVCMVSARSAAMGFNRLVDARMDALNPRTAMRELPAGRMTRGEATVAELAARGKTNAEIAEALGISRRAVEKHLTSSYRKLRIDGRPDLAAALGVAGE